MNISLTDRLISVLSYFTMGILGFIWIIFCHLTKKRVGSFLAFNIYQSIFLSVLIAVLSMIYSIGLNIISIIPFIGKAAVRFDLFFNQTPIYFSYTLSGLILAIIVCYLAILSLIGKKPFIPWISNIIYSNFGG